MRHEVEKIEKAVEIAKIRERCIRVERRDDDVAVARKNIQGEEVTLLDRSFAIAMREQKNWEARRRVWPQRLLAVAQHVRYDIARG
jgi:hypothetical protein